MLERIYVEIGNICNMSCSFCPGTKRERRQMTLREFSEVAEKVKGYVKYLYLHLMGEPLLHNQLGEIIDVSAKNALAVCITTNGTLLRKSGEKLIQRAEKIHKICISLHSFEGNELDALSDGYLETAVEFAKKISQKGSYVVFRLWNVDSAEAVGKNSRNSEIESYLKRKFPDEWQARRSGFRLSKNIFLEYDGVFVWPTESEAPPREAGFCHGALSQLGILVNGDVVPCCLDSEGEIVLGNIFLQSMEEILHAPRLKTMVEGFNKGEMREDLCKKCSYAKRFKER